METETPRVEPEYEIANILDVLFLNEFEKRQTSPVEAVPTPLPGWNRVCGDDGGKIGLAKGWLVTVGGNPGFGKSLFALNMAKNAVKAGETVGFVSLEMSPEQLAARMYAILTETPIGAIERGQGFDKRAFDRARSEILLLQSRTEYKPFLVASMLFGIVDIITAMGEMYEDGCRWFVLDYMQLAGVGTEDDIYSQVTEVVTTLRQFAHRLGCVVIGLSQFNRRTSADYTQSPRCQGLHGGMPLEANSDQVVLLDHSRYERDKFNPKIARTWVMVDKNRHGGTGSVPVLWDYETLTIREGLQDEESQWPKQDAA